MPFIGYIGKIHRTHIEEAELKEILASRARVVAAIEIENLFSVFAEAFVEYERYNIGVAIETAYDPIVSTDMQVFFGRIRQKVNLNVLSFLTAAGAYRDQLPRLLSKAGFSDPDLKSEFRTQFDSSLEYRVMYALRNHSVHKSLPLGGFSFGGRKLWRGGAISPDAPTRLHHSLAVFVRVSDLVRNSDLNSKTRAELSELKVNEIDLNFLVRGYVESLYKIHSTIREKISGVAERDLDFCVGLQDRFGLPAMSGALIAVWRGSETSYKDVAYVDASNLVHLSDLRRRWSGLQSARRIYASSVLTGGSNRFPKNTTEIWVDD